MNAISRTSEWATTLSRLMGVIFVEGYLMTLQDERNICSKNNVLVLCFTTIDLMLILMFYEQFVRVYCGTNYIKIGHSNT